MKTAIAFTLAAALLAPASSRAQTPEVPRHDRARTFLVLRLVDELSLPDDKALQISAVLSRAEDRRRDLVSQRDQVETQLRDALGRSPLDEAQLAKLIAQANDLDQQISQVRESAYREMQKLLTVEQQAKLVLFRPQLQKQIRHAIRKRLGREESHRHRWREG